MRKYFREYTHLSPHDLLLQNGNVGGRIMAARYFRRKPKAEVNGFGLPSNLWKDPQKHWSDLFCHKGRCQKKKRENVGICPKWGTPPPSPLFGNDTFV